MHSIRLLILQSLLQTPICDSVAQAPPASLGMGEVVDARDVFDAVTGRLRWRTPPGSKGVNWRLSAAAFSPDGRTLVSSDSGLTVWDVATGKVLRQLTEIGRAHV